MSFGVVLDQAANAAEHISTKAMYEQTRRVVVLDSRVHSAAPTHLSPIPEKFL